VVSLNAESDQPKERVMKVLMVLTSHDQLGNTGRKTGFWLEEMAEPYYVFKDVGAQITLASPKGGRPPLDPKSEDPRFQTDITRRCPTSADGLAAHVGPSNRNVRWRYRR
jgi:putative intracellular protease/amidase